MKKKTKNASYGSEGEAGKIFKNIYIVCFKRAKEQ